MLVLCLSRYSIDNKGICETSVMIRHGNLKSILILELDA